MKKTHRRSNRAWFIVGLVVMLVMSVSTTVFAQQTATSGDLRLETHWADPNPPSGGSDKNTTTVQNIAPSAASAASVDGMLTNVKLSVDLLNCRPTSVVPTKGTVEQIPLPNGISVDWSVGTLAPGESQSLTTVCDPIDPNAQFTATTAAVSDQTPAITTHDTANEDLPPLAIPEASTIILLGSGVVGVAGYLRLRMKARKSQ